MDQARDKFSEALGLFRQAGDHANEAAALNALGLLAQDAGQPGAALEPFQRALALRPPKGRGRAVTLNALGLSYYRLGRWNDARQAYAEALPIFRGLGDSREQARVLINLGFLEVDTGHDAAALDDFDRALALFRTLSDPPEIARALEGRAWLLRHRGDLRAARAAMEEALAVIEGHRFSQTSYVTRADFFSTQQDVYDFLIDLLMRQHQAAAALEVSERSLARSLLDGLATSGADLHREAAAAPELHARERRLKSEIDGLVSRQTFLSQDAAASPQQLRPIEAELRHHWEELDQVRTGLRAGDPRYAALTQPRPWRSVEIQRRLLDRGTLLLEYRLGEKRSFLWAVTPDSVSAFDLPGRAEIEDLTRQTYGLLARSAGHTAELSAEPLLAKLSQLLLGPVARFLPGKRLLVVGDGILQSVPFAALPEPGGREPLISHHEIVSLPSISVLGELRREVSRRQRAPKILWVLANPEFGGMFSPLPYTEQEAAAILEFAPAAERFEVLGREASRTAVLRGSLRDYRFLHFATHGSFSTGDPGGVRLVLAQVEPNGFLYLADIYDLDLRADLVVLSACQSALGREVRGEGMMGMTRGFFYAGAERVLVSLWNVPDRPTVELMRLFYRGILVGHLSPAAALRAAQDKIRHQEGWRAPYYWAGFTLQGEWRGLRSR
jgi:CHAT domain-containing protein